MPVGETKMVGPNKEELWKKDLSSDENPVDIPLYWLVNRDPYIGLL